MMRLSSVNHLLRWIRYDSKALKNGEDVSTMCCMKMDGEGSSQH
jgi:hypothetical protein